MSTDLNKLGPAALKAAMQGGTASWGQVGSAERHVRYMQEKPKTKRRKCPCGCNKRETHLGMANGLALMGGCEMLVRRWVKTGNSGAAIAAQAQKKEGM